MAPEQRKHKTIDQGVTTKVSVKKASQGGASMNAPTGSLCWKHRKL